MHYSRATLVLMAGLPGAGKTSLAYALGRELGWQVIDKDMYKQVLSKQGLLDDDQAGKIAYDLAFAQARTLLLRHRVSAILDTAALQHFIIEEVLDIVRDTNNTQLKVIFCVADRDLRNQRLRIRPYQPTSIRVDPATILDYLRYYEHLPENKLTLLTNIPLAECIIKARAYIELDKSL